GVVTYGLLRERHRPAARLLLISAAVLIGVTTRWPGGGGWTLWELIFDAAPGAKAIRAVGRIALILLVPASIGLAWAFENLSKGARPFFVLALAVLVIVEQGQSMPSYPKDDARKRVQALVLRIPKECESFFAVYPPGPRFIWEKQLDAMWAGITTHRPTVNGYSSNLPPGWERLFNNQVRNSDDVTHEKALLAGWLRAHGRDPARTCFVSMAPR